MIYILNKNVNDDGPDALEGAVAMVQLGGQIAWGNSEDVDEQRRKEMMTKRPGEKPKVSERRSNRIYRRGSAGRAFRSSLRGNA